MPKIKYKFNDGIVSEVEVDDELYLQHLAILQNEKRNHWRETRRHDSLDLLIESGVEIGSEEDNPLYRMIERENRIEYITTLRILRKAGVILLPAQRKLLSKVFVKNETLTEIAEKEKVSRQAIQNRLKKIFQKIKKFLN